MMLKAVFVIVLLVGASGYRDYQDRIPNGDHVPHPCKPNFVWRGVGHMNALGGGANNVFGLDFKTNGKKWSRELCEKDSDGDGRTNGEELGDPNCIWEAGTFPQVATGITHPGICDPYDSPQCRTQNTGMSCNTGEFICPSIHEPHVRNITLRFPKSHVPAEETSYMCMNFDLKFPDDDPPGTEYHLIATEPIIDNPNVMHHITLTGCVDTVAAMAKPELCYMSQEGCGNTLALWTLGLPGDCMYKDVGFKIGSHGTRKVMMQFHWTNPERIQNYFDESGLILYYTTKLRKYNAGFLTTGQLDLVIPPGESRVTKTSTCSSECTRSMIDTSIHITTGLNHMHYLGYQERVELYRNEQKVRDLTWDEVYSYDNPVIHVYDPPQLLLPGDRLETSCIYRSTSKTRTTKFGEGTYDEMCFGIFQVYPIENVTFPACVGYGNIEVCGKNNGTIGECHMDTFYNVTNPIRRMVLDACNIQGQGTCPQECQHAVTEAREHPCLQGEVEDYTLFAFSQSKVLEDIKFLTALTSCDCLK